MKSYTLLRINDSVNTLTVMMDVDGNELQQDIDSAGITDQASLTAAVTPMIDKLAQDLQALPPADSSTTLSNLGKLVGVATTVG